VFSGTKTSDMPLVVDLDGTLIYTDLLHESILYLLKAKPWLILQLPVMLLKGRAGLKSALAKIIVPTISLLPFNLELIEYVRQQRALGRKTILCTASNQYLAQSIADHLGIFDEVLASDENVNLAGSTKAKVLCERYGYKGFHYAGNSQTDFAVWAQAHGVIVVNASRSLNQKIIKSFGVEKSFPRQEISLKDYVRVLRLHQWVKNILIFTPVLVAHTIMNDVVWKSLVLAFVSFGLCASFVYVLNDLLDLESDRLHCRKRLRPFASGKVPIWAGVLLTPFLILSSILLAIDVGPQFLYWLLIYLALTSLYSWGLKRIVIVDVLTLAILYTLRIVSGAAAVQMPLSFWILAFSIFLFLSLAFIKRDAELQSHDGKINKLHGRGYILSDASIVQQLGVSSGYSSVMVLALYINSENVIRLYRTPEIIWAAVPLLIWWLSWMWIQANRGKMHDDPIVFAIKDKTSLFIGVLFIGVFALAK
jgi:4-hydroxybenzoate polyprenyltransferase/phosphoserine phosphatase